MSNKDNKVKPQTGQTWANNQRSKITVKVFGIDLHRVLYKELPDLCRSPCASVNIRDFIDRHEFVPANELERLALMQFNHDDESDLFYLDDHGHLKYDSWPTRTELMGREYHSYYDIKECRYKLGLDDRPKVEVKMLYLSGAVVGDQFDSNIKMVLTVKYIASDGAVLMEDEDGTSYFFDGELTDTRGVQRIISKHDPRPWLSQLPDASMFALYETAFISCNYSGVWLATNKNGSPLVLDGDLMPKLTGDQWRQSKTYIVELAKWQAGKK